MTDNEKTKDAGVTSGELGAGEVRLQSVYLLGRSDGKLKDGTIMRTLNFSREGDSFKLYQVKPDTALVPVTAPQQGSLVIRLRVRDGILKAGFVDFVPDATA